MIQVGGMLASDYENVGRKWKLQVYFLIQSPT